jgi:anti-sigma B factor antagonist
VEALVTGELGEVTPGMVDGETRSPSEQTVRATEPFVVELAGDVDMLREAELRRVVQRYLDSAAVDAVVDLGRCDFMDTTGLTFLVGLRRAAARRGGAVVIARPSRVCRRILEVVAFDRIFEIRE